MSEARRVRGLYRQGILQLSTLIGTTYTWWPEPLYETNDVCLAAECPHLTGDTNA